MRRSYLSVLVLGVVLGIVLTGAWPTAVADPQEATELTRTRALEIIDGAGRVRIRLAANMLPHETPAIELYRANGHRSISLRETSLGGGAQMEFLSDEGRFRLAARMSPDGVCSLVVHNKSGEPTLTLRSDGDGQASILDRAMNVLWKAP